MTTPDWIIFIGYLIAMISIGLLLGKMVKNTSDLFAAGGQSPWWVSGLSGFMAMFSANTFVVWGGIAYKYGVVAIVINLCYGLSAVLVGYTIAGKWKRLGIKTPTEYIQRRFGNGALQFYTWFMMVFRILSSAGALYAFATIFITALWGAPDGSIEISLTQKNIVILLITTVVVIYTMSGGLWAVLMTDTIQFIILNLAVIFVIPLTLMNLDVSSMVDAAPEGFFLPTSVEYSVYFLIGWFAIHYFVIGAELAYVQRYICVPTEKDARKSAYLFGVLYLVSPILWLTPPLLWRLKFPPPEGANIIDLAEKAYIISCKSVLPSGMLGLMVAALFAATASMMSAQLNVFSGVLTHDIYRPLAKNHTEKSLVFVGRVFTVLIAILIAGLAIAIPYLGGVEKVIIKAAQVMAVPILAPVLIALLSKRLASSSLWITVLICLPLGLLSVGINSYNWFPPDSFLGSLKGSWIADETTIGIFLPIVVVLLMHVLAGDRTDQGWKNILSLEAAEEKAVKTKASPMPLMVVAWSMLVFALMMLVLTIINTKDRIVLGVFVLVLAGISAAAFIALKKLKAKYAAEEASEKKANA